MSTKSSEHPPVDQPPRTVVIDGKQVDVSHLSGDALYEAITADEEHWTYQRLSAETGRTVIRIRVWVVNATAAEQAGKAPDDKAFLVPDDRLGWSPWWYAGRARRRLMQMGVMTREGVAIPYRPSGRTPGAKDGGQRTWAKAPVRDTSADIYREYLKLTTRKRSPLSDRQARAEMCERHNLSRTQLARRINTGREQVEGADAKPVEVDRAALRARLAELIAEQRAAGYTAGGANARARKALAEETGLTRRQIAGYTAAVGTEHTEKGG